MNPADPDDVLPELIAERFGRLADVAREGHPRPLPSPPARTTGGLVTDEERAERLRELEARLAQRLSPGEPGYDPFYDATDEELAAMVPTPS